MLVDDKRTVFENVALIYTKNMPLGRGVRGRYHSINKVSRHVWKEVRIPRPYNDLMFIGV